ncbi:MAG: hypothetical protein PQJ58_12840 [Spirochaetales bacterium]|nr:hypothetical protein [Spirochaetales bacterium]
MYEIKEATCDCCRTVFRAVNQKHYCSRCNKYYYVCKRCNEEGSACPDCGINLKRKTPPLSMLKGELGIEQSLKRNLEKRERYFSR